jgi:hypothetical protein
METDRLSHDLPSFPIEIESSYRNFGLVIYAVLCKGSRWNNCTIKISNVPQVSFPDAAMMYEPIRGMLLGR